MKIQRIDISQNQSGNYSQINPMKSARNLANIAFQGYCIGVLERLPIDRKREYYLAKGMAKRLFGLIGSDKSGKLSEDFRSILNGGFRTCYEVSMKYNLTKKLMGLRNKQGTPGFLQKSLSQITAHAKTHERANEVLTFVEKLIKLERNKKGFSPSSIGWMANSINTDTTMVVNNKLKLAEQLLNLKNSTGKNVLNLDDVSYVVSTVFEPEHFQIKLYTAKKLAMIKGLNSKTISHILAETRSMPSAKLNVELTKKLAQDGMKPLRIEQIVSWDSDSDKYDKALCIKTYGLEGLARKAA